MVKMIYNNFKSKVQKFNFKRTTWNIKRDNLPIVRNISMRWRMSSNKELESSTGFMKM